MLIDILPTQINRKMAEKRKKYSRKPLRGLRLEDLKKLPSCTNDAIGL